MAGKANSETHALHDSASDWRIQPVVSVARLQPSAQPVLYMAHMDVVPADTTDPEFWAHPRFREILRTGLSGGRGTLDDKASLMGLMEAAEVNPGFSKPEQTIYFAFGHDEELGAVREPENCFLSSGTGITLASVLDEGFFVLDGMIPGITAPQP